MIVEDPLAPVETAELFTDKAVGRLTQKDGVRPDLLRELIAAVEEAKRKLTVSELEPPPGKYRNAKPGESALEGLDAALARIDRRAAEREAVAAELKKAVEVQGPDANPAEAEAAMVKICAAVAKIDQTHGLRIVLKPDEKK